MNQANLSRLMTLAKTGQPKGYAGSELMQSDLEAVLNALAESNQYTLGYKAGLEVAVKLCHELTPTDADGVCPVAETIAALPVPGEDK